jgi:DNA-binding MarR family transcriptional regulator
MDVDSFTLSRYIVRNMSVRLTEPGAIEDLALTLVEQASVLTRVVFAKLDVPLSRSEASVLARLEAGPQRITALAELDGLAQPTVTLMVKRLARAGLVGRQQSPADGRVVLVSLTAEGRKALSLVRVRYRQRLRNCLADLSTEDAEALEPASRAIAALIERLQREGLR